MAKRFYNIKSVQKTVGALLKQLNNWRWQAFKLTVLLKIISI